LVPEVCVSLDWRKKHVSPSSSDEMDFIFHMASFYSGRLTDTIYNPLPFPGRGGAAPTPFISAHTLRALKAH